MEPEEGLVDEALEWSTTLTEFFQQKKKRPTKPADLLIPLTYLSEQCLANARAQPFQPKAPQTARPRPRPKPVALDLTPIEAAREATAKKKCSRVRRSSGADQSQSALPRNRELLLGWQDLLGEIRSSSRRLRSARGGELRPRTEESEDAESESDDGLWSSYRISEEKVPDSILLRMWNYAIDPRKDDSIQSLERVPRLTVTQREVRPLPVVQDLVQWRQTNRRRREQRKAKKEAERNPSLEEMLCAIFGEQDMDLLQLNETFLQKQRAELAYDQAEDAHRDERRLLEEVRLILREDADEALEAFKELAPKLVGALRHGRRGAFDEGKASAKLALSVADLQARQDKNVVRCKKLRKGVQHTRAIRSLPPELSKNEQRAEVHIKEVLGAMGSVVQSCEQRSRRVHELFVKRQGSLSERLQRRVKRIQYDHGEIQSKKQQSILPSAVVGDKAFVSVLNFLKPHRLGVERQRQGAHSIYMRQVEKIQHFQRLLADPNRAPERGEVYLSQCFRHVLSAGLAVDKRYFFRVLGNLEAEDFQKIYTVNFLAACCDAFTIPIRDYLSHLQELNIPALRPARAVSRALPYDDTAAWDAVCLEPLRLRDQGEEATLELSLYPVLPAETPHTSELASRDDPLHQILQTTVYDAVLERYASPTAKGSGAEAPEAGATADEAVEETFGATTIPRPPIQMARPSRGKAVSLVGGRPYVPRAHATLRRMWCEPMSESRQAFVKKTPMRSQMAVVPESMEAMSP